MKQVSTLFLKGVVVAIGLAVLGLCIYMFPSITKEMVDVMPVQWELLPILISMAISVVPLYIALYQAIKLLNLIDVNKAFSELSVKALNNIKYCASIIALLYLAISPVVFMIADRDDAPGVFAIGLIIIFASSVVATLAAVIQRLLQNAIDIKKENDLTV